MTDLKSWNVVTIAGAPDAVLEDLPDLELFDGDQWDRDHAGDAVRSGWYHCTPFHIQDWAFEFTANNAGATVTWYEEFRMDDVGESEHVYRAGERVPAESKTSRMVPDNLDELIEEGKKALNSTNPHLAVDALAALVKGLE